MAAEEIVSAARYSMAELAELFTRGFEKYVVTFQMTPDSLSERVAADDCDLTVHDGAPIALALISRRGRESRLSAMGVVASARGTGAGRRLVARCLADARERGDTRHWLEVFEANEPARKLYETSGFVSVYRMVGFQGTVEPRPAPLVEHDPAHFAQQLQTCEPPDLPWQIRVATLSAPFSGARCFSLEGKAFAYLLSINEQAMQLRGILTLPGHRRQRLASRLVRALQAQFPGRRIEVPPLMPEGLCDPFYTSLNLSPGPHTLLNMKVEF
jgi:GNAT superfamily N-acetyltransferase